MLYGVTSRAVQRRRLVEHDADRNAPEQILEAALVDERRYLEKLAADVRGLVAGGKSITVAAETAAASERSHWELFDDFNARNATAAFSEIEWE